jgi:hypothetical protein
VEIVARVQSAAVEIVAVVTTVAVTAVVEIVVVVAVTAVVEIVAAIAVATTVHVANQIVDHAQQSQSATTLSR